MTVGTTTTRRAHPSSKRRSPETIARLVNAAAAGDRHSANQVPVGHTTIGQAATAASANPATIAQLQVISTRDAALLSPDRAVRPAPSG